MKYITYQDIRDATQNFENFRYTKKNEFIVDRSGLKEHMKVHSDAKEFSCDICNKSYKYSQVCSIPDLLSIEIVIM